jgi:hypothetical protein
MNTPDSAEARRRLLFRWFVWGAMLTSLLSIGVVFVFLRAPEPAAANPLLGLVALVPLFVSIVIRWLVLPRVDADGKSGLPMFLVGVALAEGSGLLGVFLGGPYRDDLFVLGVLGIVQYAPFFGPRPKAPPGGGFHTGT